MTRPMPGSRLRELSIMENKGCQIWDALCSSLRSLAFVTLDLLLLQPHLLCLKNCAHKLILGIRLWEIFPEH